MADAAGPAQGGPAAATSVRRRTCGADEPGLQLTGNIACQFYRAGWPIACVLTVDGVLCVESCAGAAAMDAVIRNDKDGDGTTSLDGGSTRGVESR